MTPFETGDVVRLRARKGGPNMLVVRCNDEGVHCVWMEHAPDEPHPRIRTSTFPDNALALALGAHAEVA